MSLLVKLFVFLLIVYFIWDKSTKFLLNPYKTIFIFGPKGSGKTTMLCKVCLQHLKQGWKVFSTVDIPGTIKFDVEDIGKFTFPENSVVVVDEVGTIWDNRSWKAFGPEVRDYFKYARQYKNKIYLFSQTFDVDLKIRNLTDEMYLLKPFARCFSLQRRIIKKITIKECADGTSTLTDNYAFDSILFGGLHFTFIPRYIPYFKSYDPKKLAYIDGEYLDFNDLQKRYLDTKLFVFDKFKSYFIKFVLYIKRLPMNIINKLTGGSAPPPTSSGGGEA